ncbi:hypothetical protein FRB96_003876 [Tulasnella sp. 330]|nr:hypothetical protein FRB96_003876 [Tulasnella sp. 330]
MSCEDHRANSKAPNTHCGEISTTNHCADAEPQNTHCNERSAANPCSESKHPSPECDDTFAATNRCGDSEQPLNKQCDDNDCNVEPKADADAESTPITGDDCRENGRPTHLKTKSVTFDVEPGRSPRGQLASLDIERAKYDGIATPPMSPELLPMPPLSSSSSPEYSQIVTLVKASIQSINDIIDLLDHPKSKTENVSEWIYTQATIRSFKVRCIECENSFEAASVTASAWFSSVSTRLTEVTKELDEVQGRIRETQGQIAKNLQTIETSMDAVKESISDTQERHLLAGRPGMEQAGAQGRTILTWMPVIATALTIAEISQDDEDMDCTHRSTLTDHARELRECRQHGLQLEAEIMSIKVTESEVNAFHVKLEGIARFLGPLKIHLENCIRAIKAGFSRGGSTRGAVDGAANIEKARRAVKSLAVALEIPPSYWGEFVTLNTKGCSDLQERIKALSNKEKPPPPPPAPVVAPVDPTRAGDKDRGQRPIGSTSNPSNPSYPMPGGSAGGPIGGPEGGQPGVGPRDEHPSRDFPPLDPSGAPNPGPKSDVNPPYPGTQGQHGPHQQGAPVSPLEFKIPILSPLGGGWDFVVHLAPGKNATVSNLLTPAAGWELTGLHLVKSASGAACCNWNGVPTEFGTTTSPSAQKDCKDNGTDGSSYGINGTPGATGFPHTSNEGMPLNVDGSPSSPTSAGGFTLGGKSFTATGGSTLGDMAKFAMANGASTNGFSMPNLTIGSQDGALSASAGPISVTTQGPPSAVSSSISFDNDPSTVSVSSSPSTPTAPSEIPTRQQTGRLSETTKNIQLDGSTLRADCQTDNGRYQPSSLNLDEILGNSNGSFDIHGQEWSKSARNCRMDGSVLTADLRFENWYQWNDAQTIDLNPLIGTEGGVLKFLNNRFEFELATTLNHTSIAMVRAPKAAQLELASIEELIAPIFQQAQFTLANHRKNVVSLHKIHVEAAQITETLSKGRGIQLIGEAAFNKAFIGMINKALPVKRGVSQADKAIKFVAAFVRYATEKVKEGKEKEGEDADEDEDTPASRLVAALIKHLLRGFQAKDKNVRYRVLYCVAEMISSIGEIDEELYLTMRAALLERVRDKEVFVRVQAVVSIGNLQEGDNLEDLEEGEQSLTEVLVDILQYDPAPDVRRAALLNITATKDSLDAILSRTRDQDTTIRKILYAHVLSALPHPKFLSIAQREEVVKNGLKDREPSVRAAAGRLVGGWVDLLGGGFEELLTMLDLIGSEEVAQEALISAFVTRPDLFDAVTFDDTYWAELTPEKAFLARVLVDHCIAEKNEARLEAVLPVVTALAFRIQHYYNVMVELAKQFEAEEDEEDADGRAEKEEQHSSMVLIIAQMLKIAVNLDYSDEIGRRKMFALVREIISLETLPEGLVARCLDVLRKLSSSERDLIRLIVEVIQELRDLIREDEPEIERAPGDESQYGDDQTEGGRRPPAGVAGQPRELTPETQVRAEAIDLRCLALCIGMLERVNSTLQDNSVLHGLLPELIIPSVRSKDPLLRERGLMSLGLCCLIDKKIALNSFTLFVQQAQVATEDIKKRVMETIFDLLMVYESEFFKADSHMEDLLLQMLDQDSPDVQAIACEGVAKLMLSGIVSDNNLLRSLIILYLIPETEDNLALRQCLSYFFPVYCYSSPINQRRMQMLYITQVFLQTYWRLREHRKTLEKHEEMVPASQMGLLFLDWTDVEKAVDPEADQTIQVDFAIEIMTALLKQEFPMNVELAEGRSKRNISLTREDKKVLCQMLPKMHVPMDLDIDRSKYIKVLSSTLRTRRPFKDTVARNAFTRFEKGLDKVLSTQLEGFKEEEYVQLDELREKFEWLDDITSDVSDDDVDSSDVDRDEATATLPHKARKHPRGKDPKTVNAKAAKKRKRGEGMDEDIDNTLEESVAGSNQGDEDDDADEVEGALSVVQDSDEE